MLWRREKDPFRRSDDIPAGEVPPGYRLRRVGPGEWVAEPQRRFWGIAIAAVFAFGVGGLAGALAARSYYHRSATPMVVTVNGVPLRRDELRYRCERIYGLREVKKFVTDELTRQFAVSKGCWPDDSEVLELHDLARARPDYLDRLAVSGLTDEEYKDQLRLELAEVKLLTNGLEVTPAEVQAFYRRNIDPANPGARFHTPDRLQVSVIGTQSAEAARQALNELVSGVSWSNVVARYSVDASRDLDGLMVPFARGESVFATSPVTEAAVFGMRPGERIGPVRAARKWWIIRCNARWRATTLPLEEVHADARLGALLIKGIPLNRKKLEEERLDFVRKSAIRIFDEAYAEVAEPRLSRPIRW